MAHWVHKRAGGRRRYNADRQGKAWQRRVELFERFDAMALVHRTGAQLVAAEYFGVSPATICRDVRATLRWTALNLKQEEDRAVRLMTRPSVRGNE